jgi:hypothetical protein
MDYEPELGQAVFCQPNQRFEPPMMLLEGLEMIAGYLVNIVGIDNDPFDNTGSKYKNETFEVQAYSWGNEEQPYNFKYKGIEISWYKYFSRGVSVNRQLSEDEIMDMVKDCIDSLKS